jgi:hypothetical protein
MDLSLVFINMTKMAKTLTVRLTENQFRHLADTLVNEERSKSSILREALHKYLVENHIKNEHKSKKK